MRGTNLHADIRGARGVRDVMGQVEITSSPEQPHARSVLPDTRWHRSNLYAAFSLTPRFHQTAAPSYSPEMILLACCGAFFLSLFIEPIHVCSQPC